MKHPVKVGGCAQQNCALFSHSAHKGFTLIELLVVIGILSVMATMALNDVTGTVGQQNFDQTVYKMKNIRRAILGKDKVVNGEPVLEGFVVDMGRLPYTMAELFNQQNCKHPSYDNQADCEGNGEEWVEMPVYAFEHCSDTQYVNKTDCTDNGETWMGESHCSNPVHLTKAACIVNPANSWIEEPRLQSGWRGPYINVFADFDGIQKYRDGWGNKDNSENFGWVFNLEDDDLLEKDTDDDGVSDAKDALHDQIELRSKGLNNVDDYFNVADNEYKANSVDVDKKELSNFEKPYPPHYDNNKALLVNRHDFQINLEAKKVVVTIKNNTAADVEIGNLKLCVGLYSVESGIPKYISSGLIHTLLPTKVSANDSLPLTFEFEKHFIPMGKIALTNLKEKPAAALEADPCDGEPSFGSNPESSLHYRALLPRTTLTNDTLANLSWEIN